MFPAPRAGNSEKKVYVSMQRAIIMHSRQEARGRQAAWGRERTRTAAAQPGGRERTRTAAAQPDCACQQWGARFFCFRERIDRAECVMSAPCSPVLTCVRAEARPCFRKE